MCGICGYVDAYEDSVQNPDIIRHMTDALYHRGPDSDGFYTNDKVVLGFRRLSIIDLSTGDQPIGNEDGSVQVVFNGEIYNFQETREELQKKGHVFRTQTDTEAIVHAYEEYKLDAVQRFRGMFAIALWDEANQRLLLMRDRVGKKPLYYYYKQGVLVFASEIKALLRHPSVPRITNPRAIDLYMRLGYIPAPYTILQDVHKLPPAHYLTYDVATEQLNVQQYWNLEYMPKSTISYEDATRELRAHLSEAVRLRMISDVPLGALLSGGVDSSIVVGLMAQHSAQPIRTFSIGFADEKFNELPYARQIAQKFGTEHTEFMVEPHATDILSDLVWHLDEPMADTSALPSYYVAKVAREHVTVVLNGDGGDESFAGYNRYAAVLNYERYAAVPAWLRLGLIEPSLSIISKGLSQSSTLARVGRLIEQSKRSRAEQFARWETFYDADERASLYASDFRQEVATSVSVDAGKSLTGDRQAVLGTLDWMMRMDVLNYLPGDLLVKMDRMTMANSLEARSPLLDHIVMEYVARLPEDYKLKNLTRKRILKDACQDLLLSDVVNRPKHGFSVPIDLWLRGELKPVAADILFGNEMRTRGIFEIGEIETIWNAHQDGGTDQGRRLWALMVLELWHQEFLDTPVHAH